MFSVECNRYNLNMNSSINVRPWWMMAGGAFKVEACNALIDLCETKGWVPGTYSDGRERPNVSVRFLTEDDGEVAKRWLEAFRDCSPRIAAEFGITVWAEKLQSIQVSKWTPGDKYGHHIDHDVRGILDNDRKLSLYVSLTEGGGLEVESLGLIRCGTGDLMAFPAIVSHAAPEQVEGERYSVVAWIPGPDWK